MLMELKNYANGIKKFISKKIKKIRKKIKEKAKTINNK